MSDFLLFLTSGFIFLVFSYCVGHFVTSFFFVSKECTLKVLIKLTTGWTTIVISFAGIATYGNTILLAIPFCLVPFYISSFNLKYFLSNFQVNVDLKELTTIGIILLLSSTLTCLFYNFYIDNDFVSVPNFDIPFYAKVSSYISTYGSETPFLDVNPNRFENSPYHYFELWTTALISFPFGLNNLKTFLIITQSVGFSLILLATYTLLTTINPNLFFIKALLSLFSLFFTGIYFDFYKNIPLLDVSSTFCQSPISLVKLFPIYVIAIFTFIMLVKKKVTFALSIASCLPLLFISTAPGLMVGLTLFNFFALGLNKKSFINSLIPATPFVIIVLYYFVINSQEKTPNISILPDSNDNLFQYCKTIINIIAGTLLTYPIIYLPFVFIFFFKKRISEKSSKVHLYTKSVFLTCLMSWAIFHKHSQAVQFFTNAAVPLTNVFLILQIFQYVTSLNRKLRTVFAVFSIPLLILIIYTQRNAIVPKNQYSNEYLNLVRSEIKGPTTIGYIKHPSDYFSHSSKYPSYHVIGNNFVQFENLLTYESLSVLNTPNNKTDLYYNTIENVVRQSSFYQYADHFPILLDTCDIMLRFIEEKRIRHITCSKDAIIPKCIEQNVKTGFTDSKSGEKFYSFR